VLTTTIISAIPFSKTHGKGVVPTEAVGLHVGAQDEQGGWDLWHSERLARSLGVVGLAF